MPDGEHHKRLNKVGEPMNAKQNKLHLHSNPPQHW